MGKKKGKKHGHEHHHGHDEAHGPGFVIPPQVAGIAAMVMGQVNSPAGRQAIAGALNAAADAIGGRGARAAADRPTPPVPPVPPVPPEPHASYAPGFDTRQINLPPEAARVIGAVGSALERFAAGLAKPPRPPEL